MPGRQSGDLRGASMHIGITEEHCPQGPLTQLGQTSHRALQTGSGDQGPGEYPGMLIAEQFNLSHQGDHTTPGLHHTAFTSQGLAPSLMQQSHPKSTFTASLNHPLGQRTLISQPSLYPRRNFTDALTPPLTPFGLEDNSVWSTMNQSGSYLGPVNTKAENGDYRMIFVQRGLLDSA